VVGLGLPACDLYLRHRPPGWRQHLDARAVHHVRDLPGRAGQGGRHGAPVRAAAEGDCGRRHQGRQRAV